MHFYKLSSELRKRNIVIKGLGPSKNTSDVAIASKLVLDHLDISIDIIRSRRLGISEGIQPRLLTPKEHKQADLIVSNAKALLKSGDNYVRKYVRINADLTPSEA